MTHPHLNMCVYMQQAWLVNRFFKARELIKSMKATQPKVAEKFNMSLSNGHG